MSEKNTKHWKNYAAATGLALLATACGQASNNGGVVAYVPGAVSCPAGQVLSNNVCVSNVSNAQSLQQACAQMGGIFATNTCRMNISWNGAPVITETIPAAYALSTGLPVKPGDKVMVSMSGSWGANSTSSKSYLGGLFNIYTYSSNCSDVNLSGASSGGTVAYNGSQPVGLMGSDGTQAFFLGASGSATINNYGTLRLGFNIPYTVSGVCGGFNGTVTVITQ